MGVPGTRGQTGTRNQDETHVVFHCLYTEELRVKYNVGNDKPLHEVLNDFNSIDFVYEIMKTFK